MVRCRAYIRAPAVAMAVAFGAGRAAALRPAYDTMIYAPPGPVPCGDSLPRC